MRTAWAWISDVRKFQSLYPEWSYKYDIRGIIEDIHAGLEQRHGGSQVTASPVGAVV
jgi:hypothetical protein